MSVSFTGTVLASYIIKNIVNRAQGELICRCLNNVTHWHTFPHECDNNIPMLSLFYHIMYYCYQSTYKFYEKLNVTPSSSQPTA